MSQFAFLAAEWPTVAEAAGKAAAVIESDPRTACFYARRALELAVHWIFTHDPALKLPYQDNLSALVHEPTFKDAAGQAVFTKARLIVQLGNQAVHSHRPVLQYDALTAVRELFHVGYWLAHTYACSLPISPCQYEFVLLMAESGVKHSSLEGAACPGPTMNSNIFLWATSA